MWNLIGRGRGELRLLVGLEVRVILLVYYRSVRFCIIACRLLLPMAKITIDHKEARWLIGRIANHTATALGPESRAVTMDEFEIDHGRCCRIVT